MRQLKILLGGLLAVLALAACGPAASQTWPGLSTNGKLAFLAPLFKRDTFVLLTLLAAAGGALGPMLCVFSLGAIGIVISVFKTELRLAREARAAAG